LVGALGIKAGSMLGTIDAYSSLDLSGAYLEIAWPEFEALVRSSSCKPRATIASPTSPVRVRPNAKAKERSRPAAGFSFAGSGAGSRSAAPATAFTPGDFFTIKVTAGVE
jgi:hypothetical protein